MSNTRHGECCDGPLSPMGRSQGPKTAGEVCPGSGASPYLPPFGGHTKILRGESTNEVATLLRLPICPRGLGVFRQRRAEQPLRNLEAVVKPETRLFFFF